MKQELASAKVEMMPSSKKAKKVSTFGGDIYISSPQLTDKICDCGGQIIEIGDCRILSDYIEADYVTMYSCIECNQPYEIYHKEQ